MEEKVDLINVESKTVNELKSELAEAYKTIAIKETEFQRVLGEKEEKEEENERLREKLALMEMGYLQRMVKEKKAEVQMLLEKIAVLEKRHQFEGDADDREPEVKASPIPERRAEEIIPEECWGLAFQNLSPEDLLSCRQVCPTFHTLLEFREFNKMWKFKLILPVLFPYLERNDLYNARLTCQSWRHWIDLYASEVHGSKLFPLPKLDKMPLVTCFRTASDVDVFQPRFRPCSRNPFPSRSVFIGSPSEPDENETYIIQKAFIRKAGKLLERFGKHIFKLRLCFDSKPDSLTLCKLIKGVATHLSNLREIVIYKEEDGGQLDEVEEDKVFTYIEENALAALPKLRALSVGGLNVEVEEYVLKAFGPQLAKLETFLSDNPLLDMQIFGNVQELWIPLDEPDDTLQSFLDLQSPLQLLKLSCSFLPTQDGWNVDKGLRNLRHLPIKLLEIHLWNWNRVNLREAGIGFEEYNNTSIKTLIINMDRVDSNGDHKISFNFLQALTKLENLEFKFSGRHIRTTHPAGLPEVVKLNEYLYGERGSDLPYHSNVWEEVPSLKTLTLTFAQDGDEDEFVKSIFTREKYERIIIIPEGNDPERN